PYIAGKRLSPNHCAKGRQIIVRFQSPTSRGNDCHGDRSRALISKQVLSVPYIAGKRLSQPACPEKEETLRELSVPYIAGKRLSRLEGSRHAKGHDQLSVPYIAGKRLSPITLPPVRCGWK